MEPLMNADEPSPVFGRSRINSGGDAEAQRSKGENGISHPASLRLWARPISFGLNDLRPMGLKIYARKQDFNQY